MIGLSRLVVIIDLIEKHMGEKKKNEIFRTNSALFFTLHDFYDIILIYVANDYYQVYIHIR